MNVIDAESTVRKTAEAVLRKAAESRNLDPILTTDRTAMGIEIQEEMQRILDSYQSGIRIVTVQMQDVSPPAQVAGDFKAVVDAREMRQKAINEAQRYANQRIPEAEAEADKMLQEAEAYKVRRTEEARGQVARFSELLEEYHRAPDVPRTRLVANWGPTGSVGPLPLFDQLFPATFTYARFPFTLQLGFVMLNIKLRMLNP